MATLQILTIVVLAIVAILSVIIGSRAHQKEKDLTQRRVKQLQLVQRADRAEMHIRGLKSLNTDTIATDVLYDYYLDTLRELLQYSDDIEKIEVRIAKAEDGRNQESLEFNPEIPPMSFQEKTMYQERLTKLAKMLLYLRRKGRISNQHYQNCHEYLKWLSLWLQINKQVAQANSNFNSGDYQVAQTLYSVIESHLKSSAVERPEKQKLNEYVQEKMKEITRIEAEEVRKAAEAAAAAAALAEQEAEEKAKEYELPTR
ncbi:DNA topoisomerase I [Marinomonas sp. C2222]|uniref:DNA topoisomerase I n=1 Tax=Marinomonas sargassi TaxID=2984494 RepID=A0ABT2YS34_9GAMM|nr:DNA topoisomerase I [Marinomonas sargassi]MCV2402701.1 DNA topoisomerase I [Marinomonas sargassi]